MKELLCNKINSYPHVLYFNNTFRSGFFMLDGFDLFFLWLEGRGRVKQMFSFFRGCLHCLIKQGIIHILPFSLMVFLLSGCSVSNTIPTDITHSSCKKTSSETMKLISTSLVRFNIFSSTEDLNGRRFQYIGEVVGESCQVSNQDSPPNISIARKLLQINSEKMNANAVLLHRCEVVSWAVGCYRQAMCVGSALNVSER